MKAICLDAGGIKGIYQLVILNKLQCNHKFNVSQHFDIFVGTSIGGVIALLTACQINCIELIAHFRSGKINSSSLDDSSKFLYEWVDDKLGNRLFGEISSKVVLPVYNFTKKEISHFGVDSTIDGNNIPIVEIVRAICADYRISEPYKIEHLQEAYIDAGFYAYDPTLYFIKSGLFERVSYILSIGSGYIPNINPILNKGEFFDLMFDTIIADQFSTMQLLKDILNIKDISYYRISEDKRLKEIVSLNEIFELANSKIVDVKSIIEHTT